ncbi:MAG: ClpXP protease specificity-enhancing factor [Pseudomonadota bacterium]
MSDSEQNATSKRPYLIRAMHEWMSDNGHTPHLVVDATQEHVAVPSEHVKDGRIVLNISYSAAHGLQLANELISFKARFSGTPFEVQVPIASVLGIYARETGQGMVFSDGDDQDDPDPIDTDTSGNKTPHLKLVK